MNVPKKSLISPRWFSWEQASSYCSLSKGTLKRLAQSGQLSVSRIGRRTVICRENLDALLESHCSTNSAKKNRAILPDEDLLPESSKA